MSDNYSIQTNFKEGPDENNIDLGEKFLTKNKLLRYYNQLVEDPKIAHRALVGFGSIKTASPTLGFTYGITINTSVLLNTTNADWKQVDMCYTDTAGSLHIAAIKTDGSLWTWGYNGYGQLGNSTVTSSSTPIKIGTGVDWKQVSCGIYFNVAVKTSGTLWSWGSNDLGQLGLSNITNRSSPVQIGTGTDWKQVSCGYKHFIAVKTDGTLWTCGYNYNGQLGLSNITNRSSPVQVGTGTDWSQISVDRYHSAAIKTDGTLWMWGMNNYGQLGVSSAASNILTPRQVGTTADWKQVSCGYTHSAAIKTDGTLWTWGYDMRWSLGISITIYSNGRNIPGLIENASNSWKYVSVGKYSTSAIKTDGTLWAWGDNTGIPYYPVLGITINSVISSITQVGNNSNWISIVNKNYSMIGIVDNSDEFI